MQSDVKIDQFLQSFWKTKAKFTKSLQIGMIFKKLRETRGKFARLDKSRETFANTHGIKTKLPETVAIFSKVNKICPIFAK